MQDYALIIGINHYSSTFDGGLRSLKGAINDADAFEAWALDTHGGKVPQENCFKVISSRNPLEPVQDDIDGAVAKMIGRIEAQGIEPNRLYFYFAGHGLGHPEDISETALCLPKWTKFLRNTALSSEEYKEGLRNLGYFKQIIFMLDCCREIHLRTNPKNPGFGTEDVARVAGETKVFVAYATHYQDASFEVDEAREEEVAGTDPTIREDKRGIFTKVLLDALNGAVATENNYLTADELRDYLVKHTPIQAQNHGYKQKPEIVHNFTSDIPILEAAVRSVRQVPCKITLSDGRNHSIELLDGSLNVIQSFDGNQQKEFEVALEPGLYLLRDSQNHSETAPIIVDTSKPEIHVAF